MKWTVTKTMTESEFVSKMIPPAVNAARRFGYLASVLVGQSVIETGYGQTDLAQPGLNNVLGMKRELLNDTWSSDYWHGGTHTKVTPEWTPDGEEIHITDTFRTYDNYQDCFYDFCQFMRDARRENGQYKYRDVLGIKNPAELIKEVRERGYCTNPEYDRAVMSIIKKWNLEDIDTEDEGGVYLVVT